MNKHQVKGALKEATGKLQQKAGKLTGRTSHRAKGLAKEVAGKAQRGFGDAMDDAEKSQRGRRP